MLLASLELNQLMYQKQQKVLDDLGKEVDDIASCHVL